MAADQAPEQRVTTERLSRIERIRRRADFERIYEQGARVPARFMTVFASPNGTAISRLGVAATRKLGPAVVRNRAKRLAREVFRRHKVAAGFDIVIVPRRELLDASFTSVEADYLDALARRTTSRSSGRPRGRGRDSRPRSRV